MPHLTRHAPDGVGVSSLRKLLIAYVKGNNDAYRYQKSLHEPNPYDPSDIATVEVALNAVTIPACELVPPCASAPAIGTVLTLCWRAPSRPQGGRSRASTPARTIHGHPDSSSQTISAIV